MNTGLMFSSKTDLWSTPQDFFDGLNSEFHFAQDACALPENAKCERYFTPEQNSLKQEWTGMVWCNHLAKCLDCGLRTGLEETEHLAIEKWNRRDVFGTVNDGKAEKSY